MTNHKLCREIAVTSNSALNLIKEAEVGTVSPSWSDWERRQSWYMCMYVQESI